MYSKKCSKLLMNKTNVLHLPRLLIDQLMRFCVFENANLSVANFNRKYVRKSFFKNKW